MGDIQEPFDVEYGWNEIIKKGALDPLVIEVEEGLKKNKTLFSNKEYMKVYTATYDMCTQTGTSAIDSAAHKLYKFHSAFLTDYLSTKVLPSLAKLQNVREGQALLEELVRRGDNHMIMNKWLNKFFYYLNRFHVDYNGLKSVGEAGMDMFKTIVFDEVKESTREMVLQMVNQERDGTPIDRMLVASTVKLFEKMGMGSLQVYTEDFEAQLLVNTRDYYALKANAWEENSSTPDYLVSAENAFNNESTRVRSYMVKESESKVLRVVTEELLSKKATELLNKENSGCLALLKNDMYDHLERMYRMFNRVENGIKPMADIFCNHVTELGLDKLGARAQRISTTKEKETNDDPEFIRDLIKIHDHYYDLITRIFNNNNLFQKALKDAFTTIVNKDVGKYKSVELMSTFCDRILKGREKLNDDEIESCLNKTVMLFTYVTEKDLFAEIYRTQLSKRLLTQKSASDELERNMIGKLKSKCGNQYTAKLEGMVSDLSTGMQFLNNFEEHFKGIRTELGMPRLDFSVQLLTTGHWPSHPIYQVNLPETMGKAQDAYESYFNKEYNGRRLQWYHGLGNATVKGTFQKGRKAFDFKITTLQAILLVQFNTIAEGDQLSFHQLADCTGMPEEVLKRVVHSLACAKEKVLKKISVDPSSSDKIIRDTDSFKVNDGYSSQMRAVRIPMASLDETHNTKRVEEDRSVAIEACIVRIMKARKTLGHEQLVAEVLAQLHFFRPERKVIKQRIENLIERDYLEREDRATYKYMA